MSRSTHDARVSGRASTGTAARACASSRSVAPVGARSCEARALLALAGASLVASSGAATGAERTRDRALRRGWTRNDALKQLGTRFAEAGGWEASYAAPKKCTSKHFKPVMAPRLADLCARQGDVAGAREVIATIPGGETKGARALVDVLCVLAGAAAYVWSG